MVFVFDEPSVPSAFHTVFGGRVVSVAVFGVCLAGTVDVVVTVLAGCCVDLRGGGSDLRAGVGICDG